MTVSTNSPARKSPAPEVLPARQSGPQTASLIIAGDKAKANAEAKIIAMIVDNGVDNVRAENSFASMAAETLRHRRMFTARPSVLTLLGDDQPDLIGLSDAYKVSAARMNEEARLALIGALRKEGMTEKGATGQATQEIERIRQSVSSYVRKQVEVEAAKLVTPETPDAGAIYLLGHGFGYSTVVSSKKNPGVIAAKSWKVIRDEETGTPILVKPPVKALDAAPDEQSDQTTGGETADAVARRAADEQGQNLASLLGTLNTAAGLIQGATTDSRLPNLSDKEKLAVARLVGKATFELLYAIGESLEGANRIQIARAMEQVAATLNLRLVKEEVTATK